jgi:hypothetical protein
VKWLLIIFAGIASAVGFIVYYESRPETIQTRKEEAKARADEKLPRKVNEANGCEVWAFKPADRWLYFTRCGASNTETVNTWDECRTVQSGKTTRQECTPKNMAIAQQPKGQTP